MRIGGIATTSRFESYWSYSFPGARTPRFATLVVILLLAGGSGLHAAQPDGRKPLPEATVLSDIDGRVIPADANDASQTHSFAFWGPDTWLFELTSDIESGAIKVPAGTRFPLLPSAMLERMIADMNDRYTPRYRLSASVTRYGTANFLLPTYYLPLSKFKDSESPAAAAEPRQMAEPPVRVVGPSDPNLAVPQEILERLRNRRPVRAPLRNPQARPAPAASPQSAADRIGLGRMLVDRIGVVERRDGRFVFIPSALGWKISNTQYELLPCSSLEQVLRLQSSRVERDASGRNQHARRTTHDALRFDVAGFVTRFKGREYLLLHRAVPVYNYGNFGG